MSRPRLLTLLRIPATVVVLLAAAGCGGALEETASDSGAAAQPADEGEPPVADDGSSDDGASDDGSSDDGGAGGPDVDAESAGERAGSPFDVDAFEQEGAPFYAEFLDQAAEHCADGACSITYTGVPSDEATDACSFSFSYDPDKQADPADENHWLIQRGTAVTIDIACPPPEESTDGSTDDTGEETG